ncbi:MAG TPA: hypothetical protein VFA41_11855 [Ktedonobacteraceae bacterium]|jgi:hypothetical protein|nr:hypothetical protein [Ktedonobacteraceae bacterium]
MSDILKDTPIYEVMVKEAYEAAFKQGRAEGRKQALQVLQLYMQISALDVIVEKFPDIAGEAWKRLREVKDMVTLRHIIVKVAVAQSKEEVLQVLPERDGKKED